MKILLVLCTLLSIFAIAHLQTCDALNALYEFKFHDQPLQRVRDMQTLDESHLLSVIHYENKDPATQKVVSEGSYLQRVNIVERSALTAPIFAQLVNGQGKSLLDSNLTRVNSVSAPVHVNFEGGEQKRSIVTFLKPVYGQEKYSNVYFHALPIHVTDPSTFKETIYPSEKDVFDYVYPFQQDEEPVYDADGVVVRKQTINTESSTVETNKRNTLRVQFFPDTFTEAVEFATLIENQQSIKLVKYIAKLARDDSTITKTFQAAKLIMPAVDVKDVVLNFASYLRLTRNFIYIVTQIHTSQVAAFNAYHTQTLKLAEGQEVAPIFIKLSRANLAVLHVENLSNSVASGVNKRLFASGFTIRDNTMILVGNTEPQEEGFSETQNAFFVKIVDTSVDGQSNGTLTFAGAMLPASLVPSTSPKQEASNTRFYVNTVSFSIETTNVDKFVIGGSSRALDNPYNYAGRMALVSLQDGDASKANIAYTLLCNSGGSTVVQKIRIGSSSSKDAKDTYIIGMSMDGPTEAPAKDSVEKASAGFWQVNCQQLDPVFQKAIVYGFFSAFGVVTFFFVAVIVGCLVKAVYGFVKSRMAGYDELDG